MNETLIKLIKTHENGLFLFDPPTGFGKTTEVVDVIRKFLKGEDAFSNVKRMFFITNLLGNLPYKDLMSKLNAENKSQVLWAQAINERVINKLLTVEIKQQEIIKSKEYIKLKEEIESLQELQDTTNVINDASDNKKASENLWKTREILKRKIANDTEPAFRKFLKNQFFYR